MIVMMRLFIFTAFSFILFSCTKNDTTTPKDECTVEITHRLRNPYLQSGTSVLRKAPSHEYVKFHIYNMEQYRALEAQGVFLLDHPFDAIPDGNLQYKIEHTKQYGVYYGVVPEGVNISNYQTEKISDLNMPEGNPTGRTSGTSAKQFSGTITFFDPIDSVQVPIKGVQVIIKDVTKTAATFTDSLGRFFSFIP